MFEEQGASYKILSKNKQQRQQKKLVIQEKLIKLISEIAGHSV